MQAQILLTLAGGSLKSFVDSGELALEDIPAFALREFDLRGLNMPASMFAGCSLDVFDRLRDKADKAGCPVLTLTEETPLRFSDASPGDLNKTFDRVSRLATAANRLGCNALTISCEAPKDTDEVFERMAMSIKKVIQRIENFDLNLLVAPTDGLTSDPDRLTALIKKVGGFKIGSFPRFDHAEKTPDPSDTMRKLAPYAGGMEAVVTSGKGGIAQVAAYEAIESVLNVGYQNTLAIRFAGKGDPIEMIRSGRRQIAEALGQVEVDEELEEMLQALEAEAIAEAAQNGGEAPAESKPQPAAEMDPLARALSEALGADDSSDDPKEPSDESKDDD